MAKSVYDLRVSSWKKYRLSIAVSSTNHELLLNKWLRPWVEAQYDWLYPYFFGRVKVQVTDLEDKLYTIDRDLGLSIVTKTATYVIRQRLIDYHKESRPFIRDLSALSKKEQKELFYTHMESTFMGLSHYSYYIHGSIIPNDDGLVIKYKDTYYVVSTNRVDFYFLMLVLQLMLVYYDLDYKAYSYQINEDSALILGGRIYSSKFERVNASMINKLTFPEPQKRIDVRQWIKNPRVLKLEARYQGISLVVHAETGDDSIAELIAKHGWWRYGFGAKNIERGIPPKHSVEAILREVEQSGIFDEKEKAELKSIILMMQLMG